MPAADEVGRLQSGKDEECQCFQKVAEQGHYAGRSFPTATRQGTYAVAPSGRLLASINSNDPAAMARMLEKALANWEKLSREERLLPADAPGTGSQRQAARGTPTEGTGSQQQAASGTQAAYFRWEQKYPADGLILRVYSRDLPRETPAGRWRNSWNQDYAWFTQAEARSLFAEKAEKGARQDVPRELVSRLACLHLIDNVRGQTSAYPRNSLEKAELKSEVLDVAGDAVTVRIEGATRTSVEGKWGVEGLKEGAATQQKRGYEARLLGRAVYDLKTRKFTSFEMLASGLRWGGTQYNGRGRDLDPAPLAFAFTLASDTPAEHTPPALIWDYGWRK